jgi:hypothetical protein
VFVIGHLRQSIAAHTVTRWPKLPATHAQVDVQLTLRLQGVALLTFGSQAADAVLTALKQQMPTLARLNPQVQQIAHFACPDPRSEGIGCRLTPAELTRGAAHALSPAPADLPVTPCSIGAA